MTSPIRAVKSVPTSEVGLNRQDAEKINQSDGLPSGGDASVSAPTQPQSKVNDKGSDKDLSKRFCSKPFVFFEVVPNGDAFCCCTGWLPKPLGNLHNNDVMAVWNSEAAREIRTSILDGSFRYCRQKVCPEIGNGTLPYKEDVSDPDLKEIIEKGTTILTKKPKEFNLAYDRTCNLSCPSCRTEQIVIKGEEYAEKQQLQDRILATGLEDAEKLIVTGSGDPFASKLYRDLLADLDADKHPNLWVHLMTNGQLFTPLAWEKWKKSQKVIKTASISMDAASEETYRIVRRGGTFQNLLVNLEFVASLRRKGDLSGVQVDFVVQQANYREMKAYVELAKHFSFDSAGFSRITNWGTFTAKEFSLQAVHDPAHPEHSQFLEILKDSIFDDPIVDLGNLTEFKVAG